MPTDLKEVQPNNQQPTAEQGDFLDLVVPSKTGRRPKKIEQSWPSDEEGFLEITNDERKRRRALASDAGHDNTVSRQEERKSYGLPEKAPSWKKLIKQFKALTDDDKKILKNMGYHPGAVTNPHSITVERMLRDLQEFRNP